MSQSEKTKIGKDVVEDSLSALLENLRDEVDGWTLDNVPSSIDSDSPTTERNEIVRYGLYLIALDVLLCETMHTDGYSFYMGLQDRAKLDRADYENFKQQLVPYIKWLERLNLQRLLDLTGQGLSGADAVAQVTAEQQPVLIDWISSLQSTPELPFDPEASS